MTSLRTHLRLSLLSAIPLPPGVERSLDIRDDGTIAIRMSRGPVEAMATIRPGMRIGREVRAALAGMAERVRDEAFAVEAKQLSDLLLMQRLDVAGLVFDNSLARAVNPRKGEPC